MVANNRPRRSGVPTIPASVHQLRQILGRRLQREAIAFGQNKLAAALKWNRGTLQNRLADPQTLSPNDVEQLLARYKVVLHVSIM